MKATFTLLLILIIGVSAQAQNATAEVETIKTTIVTSNSYESLNLESKTEVARLYKFKNSRIKKALSFTTKKNKAKMA